MRWSRGVLGAILAMLLLVGGGRSPVAAESLLWTLVASPLTAATGSPTTFLLVATNEDPFAALLSSSEIGCVEVTVPSSIEVMGAAVQSATTGATWSASRNGNLVTVRTSSGGDRLEFRDGVRFTITTVPLSAGSIAWQAQAHRDHSCGGSSALLGVPPIVVVTGPAVTPPPSPTPAPKPTTGATPAPTASPTRPPAASATAVPTPRPVETRAPIPSPHAVPTSPIPSARADRPGAVVTPDLGASGGPRGSSTPSDRIRSEVPQPGTINAGGGGASDPRPFAPAGADGSGATQRAQLSLGPLSLLGALDVWIVPGLLYGVPGILLIAFVLLQAAGAAAWLPAIRRLGDGDA